MPTYLPRVADRELMVRLAAMGAVLIEGPKACGKTATAGQIAATTFRFDEDENARAAVTLNPDALFSQPTPILFDEWQVEPAIWNRVQRQVDDRGERGLFVLTGSATPRDDTTRHSGAGTAGRRPDRRPLSRKRTAGAGSCRPKPLSSRAWSPSLVRPRLSARVGARASGEISSPVRTRPRARAERARSW